MNSYEKAVKMYEILKEKGEVTLEDIVLQFRVSTSTAYSIMTILRALCERDENCEVVLKGRKMALVYKNKGQTQQKINQ